MAGERRGAPADRGPRAGPPAAGQPRPRAAGRRPRLPRHARGDPRGAPQRVFRELHLRRRSHRAGLRRRAGARPSARRRRPGAVRSAGHGARERRLDRAPAQARAHHGPRVPAAVLHRAVELAAPAPPRPPQAAHRRRRGRGGRRPVHRRPLVAGRARRIGVARHRGAGARPGGGRPAARLRADVASRPGQDPRVPPTLGLPWRYSAEEGRRGGRGRRRPAAHAPRRGPLRVAGPARRALDRDHGRVLRRTACRAGGAARARPPRRAPASAAFRGGTITRSRGSRPDGSTRRCSRPASRSTSGAA